jgi:hypothetical protein
MNEWDPCSLLTFCTTLHPIKEIRFLIATDSCLLLLLSGTRALRRDYSHDLVAELPEKSALGGLGHKVDDHIAGGAPLHGHLLLFYPIRHKEVTDVDVLRALAAPSLAIPFQKDSAFIVLVDNVLAYLLALSLQEIACPADGWHAVID